MKARFDQWHPLKELHLLSECFLRGLLWAQTGFWLLALNCSTCFAVIPILESSVLRFDAGPQNSSLANQSIALNQATRYPGAQGFGWITPPTQSFTRSDLERSRTALTIDGVAGKVLDFRVDVSAGRWNLFIWLELGEFDRTSTQLFVQGEPSPIDWQEFPANAEPNQSLPRLYRVFVSTAEVESDGLVLKFKSEDAEVRLLGISLVRQVDQFTPAQQDFTRNLNSLVGLNSHSSILSLFQETKTAAQANSSDSVLAFWLQRMEFVIEAEKYYDMRGWEWASDETGLSMFDRHHQAIMLLDAVLAGQQQRGEPLMDRARYLRGRMLYWLGKERGGNEVSTNADRDLRLLFKSFPQDDLLAMYNGKQIDSQDECDCIESLPAAPAWSVLQREALCRMRAIAHWWTTERQIATGEFGGKFGDDVELLRWWSPLCLAGDQIALKGWKLLADGVWRSKHVDQGYARKLADVEHASEFIADTAPLMAIYSDAPEYLERLQPSAELFQDFWTGVTPQGNRFFRSSWFNATELETTEPKGRDVELNCRAVKAVRYLNWRRPDPVVTKNLHEWSMAWVKAALSTKKGKPRGILPASIRFEDEAINGDGENWYQANMYWDYFDWDQSAGSLLLDQLLFTYLLTNDERLLQPLLLTLELIQSIECHAPVGNPPEGSPAWAAQILRKCDLFWNVVEQWRFVSNNHTFDELIMRYGSPYGQYRVSGDEQYLIKGLETLLEDLRYNTPLKTSEALYTDRVYVAEWETLKGMLTGDGIQNNTSPYFSVSWEETDEDFTALVSDTNESGFTVQLFSHAKKQRNIVMRVWRTKPGKYLLRSKTADSSDDEKIVSIQHPGERIPIELPAQRLLKVELTSIREPHTVD